MSSDRKVTCKQTYYRQHLIWMEDIVPQQVKYFSEEFGDNIRDTCETLVDLFHCLFARHHTSPNISNSCICHTETRRWLTFSTTKLQRNAIILAVNILVGIKKLPSYKDYWWSSDKVIKRFIHSIHDMQESF